MLITESTSMASVKEIVDPQLARQSDAKSSQPYGFELPLRDTQMNIQGLTSTAAVQDKILLNHSQMETPTKSALSSAYLASPSDSKEKLHRLQPW